jgi:hypothetical protein
MMSVFQIFRILLSIMIMIFVLLVFLRIADMYSSIEEMKKKTLVVSEFEQTVRQVYTSGYPATFPGFEGFSTILYDPEEMGYGKIKSDAGVKTISLPMLFKPDIETVAIERHCLDFGWCKFCWVSAFPKASRIFINPVMNTPETRALVLNISENFQQAEIYLCSGSQVAPSLPYLRTDFTGIVNGLAGQVIQECDAYIPEPSMLVVMGPYPSPARSNVVIINPSAKTMTDANGTRSYNDASDIAAFITGGPGMADYKKRLFNDSLSAAAVVMRQRSLLLNEKFRKYNVQPCLDCPTPQPMECGWKSYTGIAYDGSYKDFYDSIGRLVVKIDSGNYWSELSDTERKYGELKASGCE